jgi:hypothetical protein
MLQDFWHLKFEYKDSLYLQNAHERRTRRASKVGVAETWR